MVVQQYFLSLKSSKKLYIVNDQLNESYEIGNGIIYNREVLIYNLCDYSDA